MEIMPTRYEALVETIVGYEQTGVPLIALADGRYVAAGYSDNKGLHYVVPRMVEALGLSLDTAIDAVLYGALLAGFAVGLVGMLRVFKTTKHRVIAVAQLGLLLAFSLFAIADVYVFGVAATVAVLPWALLLLRECSQPRRAAAFCLIAGLIVGLSHQFRAQSGTAAAVLVVLLIWMAARPVRFRAVLTAAFCGAALVPGLWFERLAENRDAFLAEHSPAYFAETREAYGGAPWHSIYIGFAFLTNPYVSAYQDEVAIARVREVNPETAYLSREYQNILRQDVLDLVREHPGFVLRTLSAKAGALLFWVLLFGNIGLLVALGRADWCRLDAAFAVAALAAAAPGVLVMPLPHYVSSLLAVATVYGVVRWNGLAQAAAPGIRAGDPLSQMQPAQARAA
jgi:hypothetical protein